MNAWFFQNPAAVATLREEAASWLGTPFFEFSCAKGKGGGIDCIGLAEQLMIASGVCAAFHFPRTHAGYQCHGTRLEVLRWMRGHASSPDDPSVAARSRRLAEIFAEIALPRFTLAAPTRVLMPGDLLILRSGSQFHMPIILDGPRFIHCMRPAGVAYGSLHDSSFLRHLIAMFRARAKPLISHHG